MTELNRRHMLIGAAAAGVAVATGPQLVGSPARASAPAAGRQAPAFYRTKVGDFEVTQIADGARTFPMPQGFVRNVPREQALAAAEAAYMPAGMVTVPFNPVVINTGSKLVLIDAGYGPETLPTAGLLPANMAAAGIDARAIDVVVLSHLHPDHCNGIRDANGGLAFPNAEIKAPAADWAFWMSDDNMGKAQDNAMMKGYFSNVRKVFTGLADRVVKYDWGQEVAPGITALDTSGHTPGHTSFAVSSGNGQAAGAVGRDQHPRAVPAQSGVARGVRHRSGEGGADAAQVLRHGCNREDADLRLPLLVPVDGLCREGRHQLSAGAGALGPGALSEAGVERRAGQPDARVHAGGARQALRSRARPRSSVK